MKFKYIGNKQNTNYYNIHAGLKTGDVIELTGHMAKRAKKNKDFKEVGNASKVTMTPEEGERLHAEQNAVPPQNPAIAALQRQLDELKAAQVIREEEGPSVDDAFMEPAEIDED